ncbi:MAG TPA: MATE family efflux transporter, partial [Gemmataceae bacterium]|nr:MATE family efflux transporter [Gemmataceae bacterium]
MLSLLRKITSRADTPPSPLPALENAGVQAGSATWKVVLALAWPVLAQQFLILLVTLSDSFLAGHFQPLPPEQQARAVGHELMALGQIPGPTGFIGAQPSLAAAHAILAKHIEYQAAQTTAHYLAWVISSYCVFVSVGSTALVARFIGAGDHKAAIHTTNQSIVLAIAFGLAGTLAGLIGMESLVTALQLKGETASLAVAYLRPLFFLLTFQVIEAAGIACLIGAGDTRTGLWVRAGVAVVNLPFAWALFHGFGPLPALRFEGIALGTALSNLLGGVVVLTVLARGRAGLGLSLRFLRPDWALMRRLLRISVPAGVDSLSLVVGQLWFLTIVNGLGDTASGAHGIALRWEALGYLSGAAFGTAAMTLVGQNLGARQPRQAARSGWVALGLGGAMMCTMGLVFFVLAPQMFALFCGGPEQEPVIEAGVPVLRLVAFAMPALACCIIFTYALRGAGDTRVPLLFTWIGFLGVRIPLAYLLTSPSFDWTLFDQAPGSSSRLFGAWLAMFADILVRGAFFLYRFASGRWKTVR